MTASESQERTAEIEFNRKYNETTFELASDGRPIFYGVQLLLIKNIDGIELISGEELLHNELRRSDKQLTQHLGSPIFNEGDRLIAKLSSVSSIDYVVVSGSYIGEINYSYDSGPQEHNHNYP